MPESIFDRKARVRPPRVHITYEVETNGAMVQKEIPFVVGVLSDLSGMPSEPLPRLKDRKFTEIDRDNFDDVLKSMKPRVAMYVENTLKGDGSEMAVELNFQKLSDFRPENVVRQVEPLAKLQQVRNQLKDMLGRLEGNDRLDELLNALVDNAAVRDKLGTALISEAAEKNAKGGDS